MVNKYRESDIQRAIIKYARLYKLPLISIPNGANVNSKNRLRLYLEGMSAGFPDLFLYVPRGTYHGLAIEVKTPKGVVRPEQRGWIELLEKQGYKCIIVRSAIDGVEAIKDYLNS